MPQQGLGQDHHPRGRPGLGHLDPGGRDRLRHRVPAFWRAHPMDAGRLRLPAQRAERQPEQRRHRRSAGSSRRGVYYPSQGGLPYNGTDGAGYAGTKTDGPISRPWVSLASLQGGDVATAVVRGNPTAHSRSRASRPATTWSRSGTSRSTTSSTATTSRFARIRPRTSVTRCSSGWFAELSGTVFNDRNENGRQDPGEPGHPGLPGHDQDAQQLDRGPGLADLADRHRRSLQPEPGVSAQPVQRARGLRRRLEDDRRHLPGRQSAGADDRARRGRRRQLPADHRPVRAPRLGCQALRGR